MKYRLSQVQSARDDQAGCAGVAFNIVNERGAPIVTFGYLDESKATNARALIANAIVDAVLIAPMRCGTPSLMLRPSRFREAECAAFFWLGSALGCDLKKDAMRGNSRINSCVHDQQQQLSLAT